MKSQMGSVWHFNERRRGDRNREPIVGEFFATDIIRNPAEALVRESIQNSLDAARNGETVIVLFYLSGSTEALPPDRMARYMTEGWPHFLAERNGLKEPPGENDPCNFLIIEDFGTTGLFGDTEQSQDIPGVKNPFYYFFRAEGQSGKSEQDRGRWGVGKTVFLRSSLINTCFGFTVREDDMRELLMGQAILRSHHIDDRYFSPDGYFGNHDEEGFTLPLGDKGLLQQFRQDFRLRRTKECGLSVIVPWYDKEITSESLLEAVLQQYYYTILSGNLRVTVATPERETFLDERTILSEVNNISGNVASDLIPNIQLAEWANQQSSESMMMLSSPSGPNALRWSLEWFTEENIAQMRSAMEKGERIAVRVPIIVREKKKEPLESFFDVFFVRDGSSDSGRPVFVREGIIISDNRVPRTRGVRALVVIQDKPLATLLGDAENPAHTQWQKDSSNYKGKYVYGARYIEFVTRSVSEIIKVLSEESNQVDPTILIDIFSLPAPPDEEPVKVRTEKQQPEPGSDTADPKIPPLSSRRFSLNKVAGGFSVSSSNGNHLPPPKLLIRVAYDIRRGNPLKKYHPADFDLEKMTIAEEGVEIEQKKKNEMLVAVTDSDFKLTVTGFDEHRDLYIRVTVREEDNDSEN